YDGFSVSQSALDVVAHADRCARQVPMYPVWRCGDREAVILLSFTRRKEIKVPGSFVVIAPHVPHLIAGRFKDHPGRRGPSTERQDQQQNDVSEFSHFHLLSSVP